MDRDRIVEEVRVGTSTATELLFLRYMLDSLRPGGRCGVIVPEGVLFGSTTAHKELRRLLVEGNRVEAVLSLPGGAFQPYSGVKTSVLFFRKGGSTERVLFLHAEADGYKLDANHDTPIDADDLPGLAEAYREREARWTEWQARSTKQEWTAKWWFADAASIRASDFKLSASHYRPMSQCHEVHLCIVSNQGTNSIRGRRFAVRASATGDYGGTTAIEGTLPNLRGAIQHQHRWAVVYSSVPAAMSTSS